MSYTAHDAEDVRRRVLQRAVALARPVRDTTDDVDVDDDGALLRDGNDDHARLRARLVDAHASTRAEYDAVEAALAVDDGSVDALRRAVGAKRLEGLRAKLDAQREALARVDADAVRSTTSAMAATASERGANGATASARKAPAKAPVLRDDCDDFFAELDDSKVKAAETERERLIRTGVLTPFDRLEGFERAMKARESSARAVEATRAWKAGRSQSKVLVGDEAPRVEANARPFASRATRNATTRDSGTKMAAKRAEWRAKMRENDEAAGESGGRVVKRTRRRRSGGGYSSEEDDAADKKDDDDDDQDEDVADVEFDGGMSIPGDVYVRLLPHQKTCLKWLWELHCQRAGGIIGDEMGLGKTVQVASFLGALHHSNMYSPCIVICPATMLRQWRRELRIWAPRLRATILHDSALGSSSSGARGKKQAREKAFNDCISDGAGILLTTYEHMRLFRDRILAVRWGYAILDEGHKIRNPDADVTIVAKQLQTVHRIVMSGAPIQNRLSELWSLFDFVFPGKLGTLPVFQAQFAMPIQIGGYTNASNQQVTTAFRCAVTLKDLIAPYLLRRMKCDVDVKLPAKTEQVLFCPMTSEQREAYRAYLASREVEEILDGSREALGGIDVLRKIVNHPDLLERRAQAASAEYGDPSRSGKLQVTLKILSAWREQGHRCLVFSQTQQMLDIIEGAVANAGYSYRRMDGNTSIASRMTLIDEFNDDDRGVFVFLLTTKVGGLGVNLTGANRVLLFDPDWNPSTDAQARERAWRIGQNKEVTVYRLITAGTIEEKVYHRQIYKEFLTSKVLKDPKQRRFFKARDMADLFTFDEIAAGGGTGADAKSSNETVELFAEVEGQIRRGDVDEDSIEVEEMDDDEEGEIEFDAWDPNNPEAVAPKPRAIKRNNSSGRIRIENAREPESKQSNDNASGDASILRNLFDSDNIHVAMNHDKIMNAAGVDRMVHNAEAERVARRAAEALRLSAQASRGSAGVHVPTWTGTRGAAGGPPRQAAPAVAARALGRFGRTSAHARPTSTSDGTTTAVATTSQALLSRIAARREENSRAVEADLSSAQLDETQANELMRDIIIFLKSRGGRAPTGLVIDAFQDRIQSHQHALFRQLLKLAATLERNPSRREGAGSSWVLKPEFNID
jgi:DNA excision repair protein ERCC-6